MARKPIEAWKLKQPAECVLEECYWPAMTRGLCEADYQRAKIAVRRKQVTWAELESKGLAKPPRQDPTLTTRINEWLLDA